MRTFVRDLHRRPSRYLLRVIVCLTIFQTQLKPTMSSATTSMDPQGNVLDNLLHDLSQKYKHQPVFLQSVREIAHSLTPLFEDPDKGDFYKRAFVVMTEPERTISFRVPWEDDAGNMRYNRGWRVQFSRYVLRLKRSIVPPSILRIMSNPYSQVSLFSQRSGSL